MGVGCETPCWSLGLGHPAREMPMSTQSADDSGEVESAGHRHACGSSGSPSVTGNTQADSGGWPCTLKRPRSLPCIHQLLILHTLGGGLYRPGKPPALRKEGMTQSLAPRMPEAGRRDKHAKTQRLQR